MPTYYRPSVYIEETLRPLNDTTSNPAESSAAFVGTAGSGPTSPTLITSWSQYQALYGSIGSSTSSLSYAVYSYFANGGRGAYVVRAMPSDATYASLTLYDGTGTTISDETISVTALAPGAWASNVNTRVYITITPSTSTGRFNLTVDVGSTSYLAGSETFTDLSMDPQDSRYAPDVVNSPRVGSAYVRLTRSSNIVGNAAPGVVSKVPLTGGSDGVAAVNLVTATALLDQVDRNLVVNVPAASATDIVSITNWASESGRHFIVADAPAPAANETPATSALALAAFADTLPNTSHVAVYGPWVYMADPGSSAGALRLTAPGGAVVAQYMRTDATRGVHKAPAGVATVLAGVVQPYALYTSTQQDDLAKANVNLIKTVPGSGVVIWGARTQAASAIDRYVPVRRLLISLKSTLNEVTRFAVFENNDSNLWELMEAVIEQHLQALFDQGAFKGTSYAEGFFVRCDASNNSPQTVEAGQLNVEVGVALKTPAEFVIIRIGQTQSGSAVTDSLEEV